MNITVVGVVVIALVVIGALLLVRYLGNKPSDPNEGQIPPA